ncbi:hypothetical protein Ait01nite_097620 [Actinoplanes italicus]|uniref:Inner membrane protein YhjD n=1 Tax=Actinoplanes italicus TaxID=113567 RepID=A0A2T0K3H4_9ACTN|nr:YhjD/YihY/BrkB family envelope integrity protein [Actinoplanes italicus]PRX17391.1 inner membrane protein YhjD [Actinoplanes italicus]GIE36717.1 hypothetical protein Ait01nite_097620 [Actinoplanes italicus]
MAERSSGRVAVLWRRLRHRVGWLDHLVRAGVRYDEADGGRLAAAVTYYAFFGTFAAWLMGFAAFGFVLDDPRVLHAVENYLAQDLPGLDVRAMRDARTTVGVVAIIGLPITGWFWADAFRSSIRRIWRLAEYPGRLASRVLVDLAVLLGLGVLLVASLAAAYATTVAAGRIAEVADAGDAVSRLLLGIVGFLVGTGVNTALACGALTGLPRIRMSWRRLLGPAVLAGVAIELLKTIGSRYIQAIETNPVYGLVAGSVGLLVLLNAVNQLLLFAAALTATSTAGSPSDLATRDPDRGEAAADRGPRAAGAIAAPSLPAGTVRPSIYAGAMTTLAGRTIAALRSEHDGLESLVPSLSADQLTGPSGASEWTIADVLSHLGSGAEISLAGFRGSVGEAEAPGPDFNQSVWDRWNALSPQEQATGVLASDQALVTSLESVPEDRHEDLLVKTFLPEPVPLASFAALRLSEVAQHTWDVRAGLDPSATLAEGSAEVLAEHLVGGLGFLLGFIGKAKEAPEHAVVEITGTPYRIVIDESVRFTTDTLPVTATFTGPLESALRLLYGRLGPDHTAAGTDVTGNITLDDLRAVFPGF